MHCSLFLKAVLLKVSVHLSVVTTGHTTRNLLLREVVEVHKFAGCNSLP